MPALVFAALTGSSVIPVALLVLALVAIALIVAARRRGPRLELKELSRLEAARYLEELDAVERQFVDNPQQAAARARGIAEEVLRRMGFPDRIDAEQKARDLARHDGDAAKAIREADQDLRRHSGDTERLRRSVQRYRDAVQRLLKAETLAEPRAEAVAQE